jgi:hypothetical protein
MMLPAKSWRIRFELVATVLVACLLLAPAAQAQCPCDCDGDGAVAIDEIITVIGIALGSQPLGACPGADGGDGEVTIDEILACVSAVLSGCPEPPLPTPTASPTPTPTPTVVPEPTPTPSEIPPIPTTSRELLAWLQAGHYTTWASESAPHPSGGPHGGTVRTYLNDVVLASLQAGNPTHPAGSAIVKELYFSGSTVRNWAVEIKIQDDSAGGRGWYWWEGVGLQGVGLSICTGCHGQNYRSFVSKDFVLTPFPLQ